MVGGLVQVQHGHRQSGLHQAQQRQPPLQLIQHSKVAAARWAFVAILAHALSLEACIDLELAMVTGLGCRMALREADASVQMEYPDFVVVSNKVEWVVASW